MGRRALLPLALCAVACGSAAGAGPASAAARPCVTAADSVVARGAQVVVTARRRQGPPPTYGWIVHACERRSLRRTRLDDPGYAAAPDYYVEQVLVRGRFVAYAEGEHSACSSCGSSNRVRLVNARTGRRRTVGAAGCGGGGAITDLVGDSLGRLGWICHRSANTAPDAGQLVEVRKLDRAGPGLLDSSTSFERQVSGPLRLDGDVLSWSHGGEPRSATLR